MKLNMLVVEDNELSGTIVSTLFKRLGFEVTVLGDGALVLPYLEKNEVDILILDLELPGMTGDKIYGAMKENPKLIHIPIVPFTAHRDTHSANTLPANLIWAEYTKTGKTPSIIFKTDETGPAKDVNRQLVDEVAQKLMEMGKSITNEMADYYMQTRGMRPEDLPR